MKYSYNTLSGTLSNNENVCPSIGDVNLLVIPVHIEGSEKYRTDEVRNDIEKVFFSENDSDMGYKSLKEFYKESSFGKLNFQGKVTDWFDAKTYTSVDDASKITYGSTGTILSEILPAAVNWAKETQNVNLKDYDKNQDGSIDAIWLVYDHLDYTTEYDFRLKDDPYASSEGINTAYWNYTTWDYSTQHGQEGEEPTTSAFSWASFDMMYTPYAKRDANDIVEESDFSTTKLDSHTFIHETGHLLGLDDYYAADDSKYHPIGKSSMMDQNICDLDSYSKMLLGWVTPYVAYGTSEILIPTATSSDHGVIVIPSNYEEVSNKVEQAIKANTIDTFTYEFNPFSEYMMIDLYSPDGLNSIDTYGPYFYGREGGMSKTGVRIYHVDSRIFKCKVVDYAGGFKLTYTNNYEWDGKILADNEAILMPISNQKNEESNFQLPSSFNYFDQIRLLEATGLNTFDSNHYATNYTLFDTNSNPFDISTAGYQFFNGNYAFNNGNDLDMKIKVSTLQEIA